ncbi:MAG: cytochrome c oxidase assembly protein [Pseudomonadota bacterium]
MTNEVKNRKKIGGLSLPILFMVPVLMFGFGYLMVPIYNILCDITGLNGKTGSISQTEADRVVVDTERLVRVEFVSTLNQGAEWDFGPEVTSMMVHPGQQYKTSFFAHNQRNQQVVGQAVPSVSPGKAATYFNKTECFCFNQQLFDPMERRDMPLIFIVDPDLPRGIDTVTLSYTFFDIDKQQLSATMKETLEQDKI